MTTSTGREDRYEPIIEELTYRFDGVFAPEEIHQAVEAARGRHRHHGVWRRMPLLPGQAV